jgi:hypothetical protein
MKTVLAAAVVVIALLPVLSGVQPIRPGDRLTPGAVPIPPRVRRRGQNMPRSLAQLSVDRVFNSNGAQGAQLAPMPLARRRPDYAPH